jgi:DNA mismatch endonuclease (patch repair protein)
MMSGIRSQNTKPEIAVRRRLHAAGFRYRLHDRSLPGTPDLVLRKWHTAVLVHGCFWHGHRGCRYFRWPSTQRDFWRNKIGKNMERDRRDVNRLLALGWRVAVVWECALRDEEDIALSRLEGFLVGDEQFLEVQSNLTDR